MGMSSWEYGVLGDLVAISATQFSDGVTMLQSWWSVTDNAGAREQPGA